MSRSLIDQTLLRLVRAGMRLDMDFVLKEATFVEVIIVKINRS